MSYTVFIQAAEPTPEIPAPDKMEALYKIKIWIGQIPILGDHPWLIVLAAVLFVGLFVWWKWRNRVQAVYELLEEPAEIDGQAVEKPADTEDSDEPIVIDEKSFR